MDNPTDKKDETLRHKARDTSPNNAMVTNIITRQVNNLVLTYGEKRFFEVLTEIYELEKKQKAS